MATISIDRKVDRRLTLLPNKIRENGFTQLEVQESLGWGRSDISQLLTKQKSLRVEQVLLILDVIGVDPAEFFGELYHFSQPAFAVARSENFKATRGSSAGSAAEAGSAGDLQGEFLRSFRELRSLLRGLLRILVDNSVIDVDELASAVKTANGGSLLAELQAE